MQHLKQHRLYKLYAISTLFETRVQIPHSARSSFAFCLGTFDNAAGNLLNRCFNFIYLFNLYFTRKIKLWRLYKKKKISHKSGQAKTNSSTISSVHTEEEVHKLTTLKHSW